MHPEGVEDRICEKREEERRRWEEASMGGEKRECKGMQLECSSHRWSQEADTIRVE